MEIVLVSVEDKKGDPLPSRKLCYFFKEKMPDDFEKTIPLNDDSLFIGMVERLGVDEARQYQLPQVIDMLKL